MTDTDRLNAIESLLDNSECSSPAIVAEIRKVLDSREQPELGHAEPAWLKLDSGKEVAVITHGRAWTMSDGSRVQRVSGHGGSGGWDVRRIRRRGQPVAEQDEAAATTPPKNTPPGEPFAWWLDFGVDHDGHPNTDLMLASESDAEFWKERAITKTPLYTTPPLQDAGAEPNVEKTFHSVEQVMREYCPDQQKKLDDAAESAPTWVASKGAEPTAEDVECSPGYTVRGSPGSYMVFAPDGEHVGYHDCAYLLNHLTAEVARHAENETLKKDQTCK